MDEDSLFGELKESLKNCREKIRKQMTNENFVVPNVTWDLIWAEMRNSWKVSSRVKNQLKSWFKLWKEFPIERPREEEDHSSPSCSLRNDDLYIVQPGDLWMDCGSPPQSETVPRTRESSIMSIDSVGQSKQGQVQSEGVTFDEKCESSASSISDIQGLDEAKTPNYSIVPEYDDYPMPKTKPWWINMQESPDQSTEAKEASPCSASSGSPVQESVNGQRCNDTEFEKEQWSSSPTSKIRISENSYFTPRKQATCRIGIKNFKERSGEARGKDPSKKKGSPRLSGKSEQIRKREPKICPSKISQAKPKKKHELSPSDQGPEPAFSFPPKDYVYQKGDWVVHAIMSSFSTRDDLKVALRERGYELKHIIKRDCILPQKWICSLIASADRTHIITSENIWLKGWEVQFTCNEEEISPFLVE